MTILLITHQAKKMHSCITTGQVLGLELRFSPLLTTRDEALAQAAQCKLVRTVSHGLSNTTLLVQQESPSRAVLL